MRLSQFTIGQRVYAPNHPLGGFAANVVEIHTVPHGDSYLTLDRTHSNGQPWRCYEVNGHVRSRGRELESRTLSRFYVYWGENARQVSSQPQTCAIVDTPTQAVAIQEGNTDDFKDFTSGVEIECYARNASELKSKLLDDFIGLRVGYDGSIHDYPANCSSLEIQTHVMSKPTIENDIRSICSTIADNGGDVNSSCGLHVHIGSAHFTNEQLLNVIKTFNALEPVIYAMQPASRRKDSGSRSYGYCKALIDNPLTKHLNTLTMAEELVYQKKLKTSRGVKTKLNKLLKSLGLEPNDKNISAKFTRNYSMLKKLLDNPITHHSYMLRAKGQNLLDKYTMAKTLLTTTDTKNRIVAKKDIDFDKIIGAQIQFDNRDVINTFDRYKARHDKSGKDRYFGLNMTSHFYRGTIEFRYHSGTVNADKILNWIKFIHCAVDYATTRFTKEQIKRIEDSVTIEEKINVLSEVIALPASVKTHCLERVNNFIN